MRWAFGWVATKWRTRCGARPWRIWPPISASTSRSRLTSSALTPSSSGATIVTSGTTQAYVPPTTRSRPLSAGAATARDRISRELYIRTLQSGRGRDIRCRRRRLGPQRARSGNRACPERSAGGRARGPRHHRRGHEVGGDHAAGLRPRPRLRDTPSGLRLAVLPLAAAKRARPGMDPPVRPALPPARRRYGGGAIAFDRGDGRRARPRRHGLPPVDGADLR